jgi:hypothetical protein
VLPVLEQGVVVAPPHGPSCGAAGSCSLRGGQRADAARSSGRLARLATEVRACLLRSLNGASCRVAEVFVNLDNLASTEIYAINHRA